MKTDVTKNTQTPIISTVLVKIGFEESAFCQLPANYHFVVNLKMGVPIWKLNLQFCKPSIHK